MSRKYNSLLGIQNKKTPVTVDIKPSRKQEMVVNNTNGYVFQQDNFSRLRRWLILGSESNSYYVTAKTSTKENVKCLQDCLAENYKQAIDLIVKVSVEGIAPKNDQAVLALAIAASSNKQEVSSYALSKLQDVCRIGTYLFQFCETLNNLRGWGKGVRKAISGWYNDKSVSDLVHQVTKYQNRESWRHRDVFRLAHPKFEGDYNKVAKWVVSGEVDFKRKPKEDLQMLWAFEKAKKATSASEIVNLITDYRLVREHIPTNFLNNLSVWEALLQNMPGTALIRNLGKMTSLGLIAPLSKSMKLVYEKLNNEDYIKKARLHPVTILNAIYTYKSGHGDKGKLTWSPVQNILDGLNTAFYHGFKTIQPCNKNFLLGIDVSGSMTGGRIPSGLDKDGKPTYLSIAPRDAAACMAMATMRSEPWTETVGFCHRLVNLHISKNDSLEDVCNKVYHANFGSTNPGALFKHAINSNLDVDAFVIYTDAEVNHGKHVFQLLDKYRQKVGKPTKFIMCGFTTNGFTLADPSDKNSMDIAGFNSSAPSIISEFVLGNI